MPNRSQTAKPATAKPTTAKPTTAKPAAAKTRGFSLIDLMIVIAIVAITAGIGLPSLNQLLAETRSEMLIGQLSRDILFSRAQAILSGHAVTLCPLDGSECINDWSKNVSIFVDTNMDMVRGNNERLLKVIDDHQKNDWLTYPRAGITYRPDGSINGFQSGTFRFCPESKTSEFSLGLVINQSGRPRLKRKNISC